MSDNKIQTQIPVTSNELQLDRNYIANQDGDMVNERGEFCGSVDYETGKVKIAMSAKQPINPANGKPYFEIRDDVWNGEWKAGEVKPITNSEFDMTLTSTCDKNWIYHANGEIWGRCVLRPLTESSNNI